jgi:hypothetical protein
MVHAGFVNKKFEALCLDKIVAEPEALARYSIHELVELSGSQGVEFLNWMAMRGALTGRVSERRSANKRHQSRFHRPASSKMKVGTVFCKILLQDHLAT